MAMAIDFAAPFAHVALPIRTPRLVLRPLEAGDLGAYAAYHADPEIQRWLERRQRPLRGATLRPRLVREAAETAARRRLVLGVVAASDGRLVGRCSAFAPDSSDAPRGFRVGLSIGILADARRQGFARESVEALVAAVRRPAEALQLRIWMDRTNAPAQSLAAGFPGFDFYVASFDGGRYEDCFEWVIPREPTRRRPSSPRTST